MRVRTYERTYICTRMATYYSRPDELSLLCKQQTIQLKLMHLADLVRDAVSALVARHLQENNGAPKISGISPV